MEKSVKYRFWINDKNGFVMGEGRVRLLESIIEKGSISKAAKSLNMSYKKAWNMINSMNQSASDEIVSRSAGGVGGGGTRVTKKGKEMIAKYNQIKSKANLFFKELTEV